MEPTLPSSLRLFTENLRKYRQSYGTHLSSSSPTYLVATIASRDQYFAWEALLKEATEALKQTPDLEQQSHLFRQAAARFVQFNQKNPDPSIAHRESDEFYKIASPRSVEIMKTLSSFIDFEKSSIKGKIGIEYTANKQAAELFCSQLNPHELNALMEDLALYNMPQPQIPLYSFDNIYTVLKNNNLLTESLLSQCDFIISTFQDQNAAVLKPDAVAVVFQDRDRNDSKSNDDDWDRVSASPESPSISNAPSFASSLSEKLKRFFQSN